VPLGVAVMSTHPPYFKGVAEQARAVRRDTAARRLSTIWQYSRACRRVNPRPRTATRWIAGTSQLYSNAGIQSHGTEVRTMPRMLNDEAIEIVASGCKVMAESMRLRNLNALRGGERTVSELVATTGANQANVSKHLGLLHQHLIVARRK